MHPYVPFHLTNSLTPPSYTKNGIGNTIGCTECSYSALSALIPLFWYQSNRPDSTCPISLLYTHFVFIYYYWPEASWWKIPSLIHVSGTPPPKPHDDFIPDPLQSLDVNTGNYSTNPSGIFSASRLDPAESFSENFSHNRESFNRYDTGQDWKFPPKQ